MHTPRPQTQKFNQDLATFVAAGMTLDELSEEFNISYAAVRAALRRRNLRAVRKPEQDYRTIIQDMTASAAIEYLLNCIETLQAIPHDKAPDNRWGFRITRAQSRILTLLDQRSPALVSKYALYDAVYFDKLHDDPPSIKIIDVFICKIRAKLPKHVGTIHTVWGQGYYLKKPTANA